MSYPVRSVQLAGPRNGEESIQAHKQRCWLAEFQEAHAKIGDQAIRNALFALWNLSGRPGKSEADDHKKWLEYVGAEVGAAP